jgi:hypothetical protein
VKADLFVNGIITAEGRTLQNATFRVSMPKPTDESLQEEANRRGVDVGGFAPDPYTIALRKQGKAAPVVFDANGVPDGYATALNKKKEK